jgi:hypothetical protein
MTAREAPGIAPGRDLLRLLIIAAVLSTHLLLTALVFASPPDPIGQSGIFDDDDADDVVLQVMAMVAVVPDRPLAAAPIHPIVWLGTVHRPLGAPTIPLYARPIRAPPAS